MDLELARIAEQRRVATLSATPGPHCRIPPTGWLSLARPRRRAMNSPPARLWRTRRLFANGNECLAHLMLRLLVLSLCLLLGAAVNADQVPIRLLTFNEPPWVEAESEPLARAYHRADQAAFPASGGAIQHRGAAAQAGAEKRRSISRVPVYSQSSAVRNGKQACAGSARWCSAAMACMPRWATRCVCRLLEDARPYSIGSYLGSGLGEYLYWSGASVLLKSAAQNSGPTCCGINASTSGSRIHARRRWLQRRTKRRHSGPTVLWSF